MDAVDGSVSVEEGVPLFKSMVLVVLAAATVYFFFRQSKEKGPIKPKNHLKTLSASPYPRSDQPRCDVNLEKLSFDVEDEGYAPKFFESPKLRENPPWADSLQRIAQYKFNQIDGDVDRTSAYGPYKLDKHGFPLNPVGRTGLRGRGELGKFGPNHAADPIVTRWKRDEQGEVVRDANGEPVLLFVAIQRRDCGLWALPGGMVDAGEVATQTVKREFGEEALNSLEVDQARKEELIQLVDDIFAHGKVVYKGYVDDPRNTDNAWMETTAVSIHDADGKTFASIPLESGDDAAAVQWAEYHMGMELYASHTNFMELAYELRRAELK
eukprot:m.354303 g.354303  ORF g.354303 m.354303 type:complete len:325 (-) comp16976_c0_seq1:208-1182(-)